MSKVYTGIIISLLALAIALVLPTGSYPAEQTVEADLAMCLIAHGDQVDENALLTENNETLEAGFTQLLNNHLALINKYNHRITVVQRHIQDEHPERVMGGRYELERREAAPSGSD